MNARNRITPNLLWSNSGSPLKSSRTIGSLGSLPFVINNDAHNATTGTQILHPANAPNKKANSNTTNNSMTWVEPDLASGMPILAISILPPGNVGIGSNETQPRKVNVIPARVNGCAHEVLSNSAVSPSRLNPIN